MKTSQTGVAILLLTVLAVSGCRSRDLAMIPSLPADNEQRLFRARATHEEVREFERYAASDDDASRTRAVEMVLFKLTDAELYGIGITQVDQSGRIDWSVAWSTDATEVMGAIVATLERAGIHHDASVSLGHAGWYVAREDFFRAQKALLASIDVKRLGVTVVEPTSANRS